MTTTHDIVQKLWSLCDVLRDDGITYHQYVTELTYLLFLKMAQETGREDQLPENLRWKDLVCLEGIDQMKFYRLMLVNLSSQGSDRVRQIFANASTSLREPRNLAKIVKNIDALDWYSAKTEGLGDLYEGLLEKNAGEKKSGAGQYFTPRPLIECMVRLMDPKPGEMVQDPALGTGGFLIMASRYIREKTDDLFDLPVEMQEFQRNRAFYGMELVPDTHRLALMNAMLHNLESPWLMGDTLSPAGSGLPKADLILTNPPFGVKMGGGKPTRDDFTFDTSNKQLAFLQHIYRGIKPGGRAAVVLPDNVLFEDKMGKKIRQDLMDKCNVHTILRLPTGIFYAQGVKTNVLFFDRGFKEKDNTKEIWIYDMRTNMPSFGKRTPLTHEHFMDFEKEYIRDERKDQGEEGRFRCFTREIIFKRDDNLDITWLRDDSVDSPEDLEPPEIIAKSIMTNLTSALDDMKKLSEMLGDVS